MRPVQSPSFSILLLPTPSPSPLIPLQFSQMEPKVDLHHGNSNHASNTDEDHLACLESWAGVLRALGGGWDNTSGGGSRPRGSSAGGEAAGGGGVGWIRGDSVNSRQWDGLGQVSCHDRGDSCRRGTRSNIGAFLGESEGRENGEDKSRQLHLEFFGLMVLMRVLVRANCF